MDKLLSDNVKKRMKMSDQLRELKNSGEDNPGLEKRVMYRSPYSRLCLGNLFLSLLLIQFYTSWGVSATFNLFMDRQEAQKLLGLPSDIFYVREGVVNEYALNFTVKVPARVEHLRFSWQSLTKKPIQYDMNIEYTNFFALLPPSSNISTAGRVPTKLESFRISLPCSGRINAEISVSIKFKFHLSMKHFKGPQGTSRDFTSNQTLSKGNLTVITLMRNKICLLQDTPPNFEDPPPVAPATKAPTSPSISVSSSSSSSSFGTGGGGGGNHGGGGGGGGGERDRSWGSGSGVSNSTLLLFESPTTPSLLLAGLLGGCAVTASIVFLIFFICLRRKLMPSSSSNFSGAHGIVVLNSDPNSSNNSSPACLLRQSAVIMGSGGSPESKWLKGEQFSDKDNKFGNSNPGSTIGSRNSYVTIASFWNDIFGAQGNSRRRNCNSSASSNTNGQQQPYHRSSLMNSSNGGGIGNGTTSTFTHSQSPYQQPPLPPPPIPGTGPHQLSSHPYSNHMAASFHGSSMSVPSHHTGHSGMMMQKGADVSPYAYAHIVPKLAPPPPPLIEWYSESTCKNGGHVFSNNMFTFQQPSQVTMSNPSPVPPPPYNSHNSHNNSHLISAPSASPPVPIKMPQQGGSSSLAKSEGENPGAGTSTNRSNGSGSLIQIDGFACRKNLIKDNNVVERFL